MKKKRVMIQRLIKMKKKKVMIQRLIKKKKVMILKIVRHDMKVK